MTRQILLTGGAGFVGKHVLQHILSRDVRVKLILRTPFAETWAQSPKIHEKIFSEDIFAEDECWWGKVLHGTDILLHLAWYTEPGQYQFSPKNLDCLIGTLRMARAARASGVKRLVGIGTCSEYRLSDQPLSSSSVLEPSSPYAACKLAAFQALSNFAPSSAMEFLWCRLFYLYGEGEDERRLVPTLRKNLSRGQAVELTNGNQVRDFLDVRQAAQQIVDLALGRETGAFNVCSGQGITVRSLANQIADEYGRRDLLKFGSRSENPIDPPYVVGIK
jgi:dTDP-6-deoxy-L-talose 4-dehydrogenase (NAD+)